MKKRIKVFITIGSFFLFIFIALFSFLPFDLEVKREVIFRIRLPEVMALLFLAFSLSTAGVILQKTLRNELADPYIVGISGGAIFGVTLSLILLNGELLNILTRFSLSFIFGLLALLLTITFSGGSPERIIILGVLMNIFFSTLSRFLTLFVKPDELSTINFYLLGFIPPLSKKETIFLFLSYIFIFILVLKRAEEIEILTFSDEEAKSLGIEPKRIRTEMVLLTSFLTACAVSTFGMIGFVGLIVPHLTKIFFKSNFYETLILSPIVGAILLLISYIFSKMVSTKVIIPAGLLINLVGVTFFLLVFLKRSYMNGFKT